MKQTMRQWLGMGALVAMTVAPSLASSPVSDWSKGDRWEARLEQQSLFDKNAPNAWRASFNLKFEVVERTSKEVRVEVRTEPENRFNEHLVLRYKPSGELLTAQVVDAERVTALGNAGMPGVFGMLGREAFDLAKAPEAGRGTGASVAAAVKRVTLDGDGNCVQTWRAGEKHWRTYETRGGLAQRATLMGGSWKKAAGTNSLRR